jgi:hypothetical protein
MHRDALQGYRSHEPPVGELEDLCADEPVLESRTFESGNRRIVLLSAKGERRSSFVVLLSATLFDRLLRAARAHGSRQRRRPARRLDIRV